MSYHTYVWPLLSWFPFRPSPPPFPLGHLLHICSAQLLMVAMGNLTSVRKTAGTGNLSCCLTLPTSSTTPSPCALSSPEMNTAALSCFTILLERRGKSVGKAEEAVNSSDYIPALSKADSGSRRYDNVEQAWGGLPGSRAKLCVTGLVLIYRCPEVLGSKYFQNLFYWNIDTLPITNLYSVSFWSLGFSYAGRTEKIDNNSCDSQIGCRSDKMVLFVICSLLQIFSKLHANSLKFLR